MRATWKHVGLGLFGLGSLWTAACSSGGSAGPGDASKDATSADAPFAGDAKSDAPSHDGMVNPGDGGPTVTGLVLGSIDGGALQGAPGDAIQVQAYYKFSDGTTMVVPYNTVHWTAPITLTAQDPNDAGASTIPEAGAEPTAFFVVNDYRESNAGVVYITDPGTSSPGKVTVSASVPEAGTASATLTVLAAPVGDAARGQKLFQNLPNNTCAECHGTTGGGSPAVDAGGGTVMYRIPISASGELFPYPAPPLNNTTTEGSPNLAADPAWSAGLLGMAAQADMDNGGVALRIPMPVFFTAPDGTDGGVLGAQDFADIYAWLKTQTH